MKTGTYFFCMCLCVLVCSAFSVTPSSDGASENKPNSERTLRFYDSLETKSTRRKIPRLIYNALFIQQTADSSLITKVINETDSLSQFNGRKIANITINRHNLFDSTRNGLERLANKLHATTRERVIRRDLLFDSGDKFDAKLMINNEQLIKGRRYIYDAIFSVVPNAEDNTQVDINIETFDSWSLSADANINFAGRSMIELYDANIFGWGNRLSLATNFNWSDGSYGGNRIEYEMPNMFGTFFKAKFIGGKNFDNSDLGLDVRREFIRPTDYEVGFTYLNSKAPYYMLWMDSSLTVKSRTVDVWGGKSTYLSSINSSIYAMAAYHEKSFKIRPDVENRHNLAFHNFQEVMASVGLYREEFLRTSLIYGYGVKEYVTHGYRAQLTGGYRWGEFSDDWYIGTEYSMGGFTRIGYLMGGFSLGSYYDTNSHKWKQATLNVGLRYFSNLWKSGQCNIRQFINLNYVRGWARGTGADELITFNSHSQKWLRGFGDYAAGLNRTVINTETVVFTPLQPLGFRMSFFGFADFGLLGNCANMFKNNFFSTFGIGVRIKNERLVFSTIQLRLGVAVGKAGFLKNHVFDVSNRYELDRYRYIPKQPHAVSYR